MNLLATVKQPSSLRIRLQWRMSSPNYVLPLVDQAGLKLVAPAVYQSGLSRWSW